MSTAVPPDDTSAEEAFGKPAADWNDVCKMFAFCAGSSKIPMNAANLCPSFRAVTDQAFRRTAQLDLDVSLHVRKGKEFRAQLCAARKAIADHLGVGQNDIAVVRNTSEGNNVIVNGFPLERGDEVVIWDENHPTNARAWEVRRQREASVGRCFTIKKVSVPPNSNQEQILKLFGKTLTQKTRVLTFTEVSNVTGVRLPAKALCELAHRVNKDLFVHVDGAQSWGALDLKLIEMGCDSFAASSHKWFCGPREVGVLYMRKEWAKEIWPLITAYDMFVELPCRYGYPCDPVDHPLSARYGEPLYLDPLGAECELWDDARRFDTVGQRDDAAVMGLADTAKLHGDIRRDYLWIHPG